MPQTAARFDTIIDSAESMRTALNILAVARHSAQRTLWSVGSGFAYATSQRRAEIEEAARLAASAEKRLYDLIPAFGAPNPAHPDCLECLRRSVLKDGPQHEASEHCESGKGPHCSCDFCY